MPDGSAPFVGTNYSGRGSSLVGSESAQSIRDELAPQHAVRVMRDYLVEVSYQGSGGVGLIENWEAQHLPDRFRGRQPDPAASGICGAAELPSVYRTWAISPMRSNFGHSTFHSGTVKLEKRMSSGVFFNTFYTFSKAINSADTDNAGGGVAPIQNRALEKARAGYDRNHRFIGVLTTSCPSARESDGQTSAAGRTISLGGWEISWIQTVESGNPLNFCFGGSPYNYYPTFAGARRPDLVGTPVYCFNKWNNWRRPLHSNTRPVDRHQCIRAFPAAAAAFRPLSTGPVQLPRRQRRPQHHHRSRCCGRRFRRRRTSGSGSG